VGGGGGVLWGSDTTGDPGYVIYASSDIGVGERKIDHIMVHLNPAQCTKFSTKFLIQIRRNSLSFYAVFIPNYVRNAISHLPVETLFLELITDNFRKQRMTHITMDWHQNGNILHTARIADIIVTLADIICRLHQIIGAHGYLITHTGTVHNHGWTNEIEASIVTYTEDPCYHLCIYESLRRLGMLLLCLFRKKDDVCGWMKHVLFITPSDVLKLLFKWTIWLLSTDEF
jgi:hypothetical protein